MARRSILELGLEMELSKVAFLSITERIMRNLDKNI